MMKRPLPEKISLIALDLDGTTLVRGHITPRTRRVRETAVKKGIHVVIATGRAWCSLPKAGNMAGGYLLIFLSYTWT